MQDQYDGLTREQLILLLRKRDGQKKLGLVWERDEIEADRAIDADFVACRIDPTRSHGPAPWSNLIIEGDNFDALRWLRMTYAGAVKCIYIDPPYNTGAKDWVYNDHYVDKTDRYRQSTWLEFLYQRLTLARALLAEDGVMLISINDEQRAKLELLCDEVMPGMRVGSLVWRTRDTTSAKGRNFSDVHEHVLVYAGDRFEFAGSGKLRNKYKNPDNDQRGDWNIDPLTLAFDQFDRPNLFYPLYNPETKTWYPCDHDRVWCFASRDRLKAGQKTRSDPMEDQIASGLIVFPSANDERVQIWRSRNEVEAAILNGDVPVTPRDKKPLLRVTDDLDFWVGKRVGFGRPGLKKFWSELRSHISPLSSWIARKGEQGDDELTIIRTGSGGEGTNEIQQIFGSKAFPNPKPLTLVKQLVRQSTSPQDIVLDFFAGSGTTAQAVMELNAEDGGARRFVLVSSTEATVDQQDKNVCRDVTAERVRRLNAATEGKHTALTAPFAYLTTRTVAFEDLDYELTPQEVWAALEALHRLPLTAYDPTLEHQEHERDGIALVFVERCDAALAAHLHALVDRHVVLTVYAWAPGQVAAMAPGVEVLPVRQTLVRFFGQ